MSKVEKVTREMVVPPYCPKAVAELARQVQQLIPDRDANKQASNTT